MRSLCRFVTSLDPQRHTMSMWRAIQRMILCTYISHPRRYAVFVFSYGSRTNVGDHNIHVSYKLSPPPFFFARCCTTLQLNIDLFKKTLGPVQKVMKDADLKLSEVDEIVLVGGSTRIPKVRPKRNPPT